MPLPSFTHLWLEAPLSDAVLARLSAAGTLVDITISDPPLEEVIARIYESAASEVDGQ